MMARYRTLILGLLTMIAWCGQATCSQSQADEPIDKLIRQLDQPISQGRADAARQLAMFGTEAARATDVLIRLLKDTQSDMRLNAAYALGCVQIDSPRVLTALLPLLTDSDEHVRYSAQWSIAQIAKSLNSDLDAEVVNELLATFRHALKEMRPREHHERHVIAIELALSRLEQLQSPKIVIVPAPVSTQEAEELLRAKQIAESMYQATDAVGRFQFVRRLANLEMYPDSLRRVVLEKESRQTDPSVLRYAVVRWGGRARSLLADILRDRLETGGLTDEDLTLLSEMTPITSASRTHVMQIARDSARSFDLRAAAFEALGRSPDVEAELIVAWCELIADEQCDSALRSCALESMSELGSRAMDAQAPLLTLLPRVQDESMFGSLARTLVAIAPTSAPVSAVLLERLKHTSADSPLYVDLVEACRGMGPAAMAFQSEFVRGLTHSDAYTRGKCVEALRQLGSSDPAVMAALIERIVDNAEEISVKSAAAETLASLGTPGQQALEKSLGLALQSRDQARMTELLRAIAITGGASESLGALCLSILSDPAGELDTHLAAVTALGSMRPVEKGITRKLDDLCGANNPEVIRSAALISLANLDRQMAARHLDSFANDASILLRSSAVFAYHLVGDSRKAFDGLVDLIDGSETDEVISRCLSDMGSVIDPWLVEVAGNTDANSDARKICFSLACERPAPDWNQLLPLVEDNELGNQFVIIAEGLVQSDEGIESILKLLESGRMKPSGQSRLIDMLFPDGLGAGDDQQDWRVLTLQQPGARAMLSARAAAESAPMAEAAVPPPAPAKQVQREPVMPRIEVPIAENMSRDKPSVVQVFYGTNRGRTSSGKDKHDVAVAVLATVGGGMVAMLLCLVGFVRSGHRFFAVLALLAMGLSAPFGYQAALKYSGDALRPSVNYDGSYRKDVELGICEVSIPPGHKPGELEAPQLLQLQFKQELDKHVVLTKVEPLGKDVFFDNLQQTMAAKGKNILVFVHGYNVSFEDAARRTAQMSFDLKFAGAPVFYSWPSQANWYGYPTDRENVELSVNQIKQFLIDLADKAGADTINLVAHSMGNVGLTEALKEIDRAEPMFNQVVLAAPDIDADVFKERIAPAIVGKARHMTLYTSQTDLALIASRYFNHGKRVGDSTDGVPLFERIETIDATSIDSSLIGHSYCGSNVSVLTDLGNVLLNRPASSREYLQTVSSTPQPYWTFDVTRVSNTAEQGTTR